jgi:hypothetical protein
VIKKFEPFLVEEYETLTIALQDYISGSLLNYRIEIDELLGPHYSGDPEVLSEVSKSIYLNKAEENLASIYLPAKDFESSSEPFPRSTNLVEDNWGKLRMLYVDRTFNYVTINFEDYM